MTATIRDQVGRGSVVAAGQEAVIGSDPVRTRAVATRPTVPEDRRCTLTDLG